MKRMKQKGFTLVELLIAITLGMVIIGAIYQIVLTGMRSSTSMEQKITAGQDVRAALELMAMEIRMASYNPSFASGIWLGENKAVSGLQESKGIQQATDNSILIEMDLDGNSAINPNSSEFIVYTLDTVKRYVTRNAGNGDQPFLGGDPATTTAAQRTVRVINGDLGIPVFTCYDGKGNVIPAASMPASAENIRRIEIVLAVETEDMDTAGQRKRLIYSTSVIPRNHVSP